MAHHKRSGPKSSRAGCLVCKPHKHERVKGGVGAQTLQERRARDAEVEARAETAEPGDMST